ncbi:hypothetical protein GUJ93_ZPchr0005g16254 [Zizania palustris]|uniref:Uncharacterized protein n=1 Tax=Zizania palustris TaxID=103762 RepID=A0A8J5VFF9_ZIZPA|nr:hypothetical protein GUJ93_ZPchr0005g16254 [Zizania palustris]
MTELTVLPADLELLAKKCKSLISLKISDCDLSDLIVFFRMATSLQEFAGGHSLNKGFSISNVGESDDGLIRFALGCVKLLKLELRSCCFSERALAFAILQMPSLRYIWVQGYKPLKPFVTIMLMLGPSGT